jgi:hypothetical protein
LQICLEFIAENRNIPRMVKRPTPLLDALFARVRRQLSERGVHARLAKLLCVSAPRLTEWIARRVDPGGETTLQLLEWVLAAEASQTKEPAPASTGAGRKTRKANIDESPTSQKKQ